MIGKEVIKIIEENVVDDGVRTYSPKPQYSRGGVRFTCPRCDFTDSSHRYITYGDFERAVATHLAEEHDLPKGRDWPECYRCGRPIKDYVYMDDGMCRSCYYSVSRLRRDEL